MCSTLLQLNLPAVGLEAAFEWELTLEEMMGTPPGASGQSGRHMPNWVLCLAWQLLAAAPGMRQSRCARSVGMHQY